MAWGDKPQHIIDMLVAAEHESAAGYLARPTLPDHLSFYYEAFWDLADYEGIPYAAIDAYAMRYGIDGDEFVRFKTIVKQLNSAWVKIASAPDKEVTESDAPTPKKRAPKGLG